jgi:hypothetical protein
LLAGVIAFLMLTWRSGVRLVERARAKLRQPEEDLIETAVSRCQARLPGTAVFLASAPKGVPLALTQFVKHNHVLHQRVVLVTVVIEEAPRIADEDRAEVIEIIEGITRVILHFGFMQYPTIAEGLGLASSQGKLPGIDLSDVTYYIGRETIIPSEDVPGMWLWRETLFAFLQRNAERSGSSAPCSTAPAVSATRSPAPRSIGARSRRSPIRCPTRPTRRPACSGCATASATTGRRGRRRRWRSSTTWRRGSMPPGRACAMPASEGPDIAITSGNCGNSRRRSV